jgi:protein-histidine pros-kinase
LVESRLVELLDGVRDRVEKGLPEGSPRQADRFLATLSHEMRTPLNAILGFTDLMLQRLEQDIPPEVRRQLEVVRQCGTHLLSLCDDMLDVGLVSAGRRPLHLEVLDAAAVVREVHAALQPMAAQRGLRLELDIGGEGAAPVFSDQRMLRQILFNLAVNAIKFTREGGVWLRVRNVDDEVELSVADSGIGISDGQRSRLFVEFSQLAPQGGSAGDARNGVGIGLHLSARMASHLGARLNVDSEPGRGSEFRLLLAQHHAPVRAVTGAEIGCH